MKKAEFQWRFAGDTFEVQVRDVNDKERAKGDSKDVRSEWEAEVYADAHVVILIVNPVKEWTFGYARELLKTMPTHMEVPMHFSSVVETSLFARRPSRRLYFGRC